MQIDLSNSNKLVGFYQNYSSHGVLDFTVAPITSTVAFLKKTLAVFSEVFGDHLNSCTMSSKCLKGAGCELACGNLNSKHVLQLKVTDDHFEINTQPDSTFFNFSIQNPQQLFYNYSFYPNSRDYRTGALNCTIPINGSLGCDYNWADEYIDVFYCPFTYKTTLTLVQSATEKGVLPQDKAIDHIRSSLRT